MTNIFNFFKKIKVNETNWDYYFLLNLKEREYPKYLAELFYLKTGENLPLSRKLKVENGKLKVSYEIDKNKCKTFNQKIQWIKLYGVTDLMRKCTDKVAVRDYVQEKIGEKYLKPVLQICNSFDEINFYNLPNYFVIKCNHGCKWHFIIKNKENFLKVEKLLGIIKQQTTGWLEQEYCWWNGLELQYRGIEPKIIIEPLLRDEINTPCEEIQVYCFNGIPEYVVKFQNYKNSSESLYDKNLNLKDYTLFNCDTRVIEQADGNIKKVMELSKQLAGNFYAVRIDWMLYRNRLYFEEMTFTPYSGFNKGINSELNKQFGKLIKLER